MMVLHLSENWVPFSLKYEDGSMNYRNIYNLGGGRVAASHEDRKFASLCAPSQNGLLPDLPHLHKEIMLRPERLNSFPCESFMVNAEPSIFKDPLSRTVIIV